MGRTRMLTQAVCVWSPALNSYNKLPFLVREKKVERYRDVECSNTLVLVPTNTLYLVQQFIYGGSDIVLSADV